MKTYGMAIRIGFIFFCIFLGRAYAGELYRWTDNEGQVHYSDKLPAQSEKASKVGESLRPLNISNMAEETDKIKEVFPKQSEEESEFRRQKLERDANEKRRHQAQCDKARDKLEIIRGRVVFYKDGKQVTVTEDERQQMVARLSREIDQFCR